MGLFKRRRPAGAEPEEQPATVGEDRQAAIDRFAAEVIAGHDESWVLKDRTVVIDGGRLEITPQVQPPAPFGSLTMASIYLSVGGREIARPVFASFSGYAASEREAVVEAACLWTCSFVPALRLGFGATGDVPEVLDLCVEEVELDGLAYRLVTGALGRAMMDDGGEPQERIAEVRARFGPLDASLSGLVVRAGTLPALSRRLPTIISTFVMEGRERVVEVKINGADWPGSTPAFDDIPRDGGSNVVLLRELGVLMPPVGAAPSLPAREAIQSTLDAATHRDSNPELSTGWRGWTTHGGLLGPPLDVDEALPEGYRQLLAIVGAPGAGPGYGMSAPRVVDGVVPLAFGGCGCTWVLRLDDEHRGEVWCDASGSDETYRPVASDAIEWYSRWLDALVQSPEPWVHWDSTACATIGVLSQLLEQADADGRGDLASRVRPGAIALTGGGPYLEGGPSQALDPCHACFAVAGRLGLAAEVFQPGVLSQPERRPPV